MPYDKLKPILKQIQVVDRSRTHHLSKITENYPLGLTDIEVLLKLDEIPYGADEKSLQQLTGLARSTISKSLKKLVLHRICYLKTSRSTKIFAIKSIRKPEVKQLGGLYLFGKIHDVFDSHAFRYSVTLPKTSLPRLLQKKARRLGKKSHNWIETTHHPHYREWGYPEPFGFIHFRIGNKGSVTVTIILETLAFHPFQIDIINLWKLSLFVEHLRAKYGVDIVRLNLDVEFEYGEVPWLLDPLAVNAVKYGVLNRYEELEQSWVPESEEKGVAAVDEMDSVYGLRQFCKNNGVKEADLAAFFKERPELLQELAKKAAEAALNENKPEKDAKAKGENG